MNFPHLSNLSNTQAEKQPSKKVSWSANLFTIRTISPGYSEDMSEFPDVKNTVGSDSNLDICNHFVCGVGQPCRLKGRCSRSNLHKASRRSSFITSYQHQSLTGPTSLDIKSEHDHSRKHNSATQYIEPTTCVEDSNSCYWKHRRNNLKLVFQETNQHLDIRHI